MSQNWKGGKQDGEIDMICFNFTAKEGGTEGFESGITLEQASQLCLGSFEEVL